MNIVFFGTPEYTLPVLKGIHKEFKTKAGVSPIVAVVTRKPKKAGRKGYLKYSAVDTWAHKRKIPIYFEAEKLVSDGVKADVGVLAAYGAILTKRVIDHFPHGILNIHPSLLPRWRGAAPVQATLVTGDETAGATIIKIDEEMDHGSVVSQFDEEIKENDTTGTLRARLFKRSVKVMTALLPPYLEGKVNLREQDHDKATYTTLIKKDHGFIPPKYLSATLQGSTFKGRWDIGFMKTKSSQASLIKDFAIKPTPEVLERFIRAMQPWPEAWSKIKIKNKELRIKILKSHIEKSKVNGQMSKVLELDQVQLEGKNPVSWEQFKEGYPEAGFIEAS